MVVLKALHLTIRVILVLAAALWVLMLVEVLPAFLTTGIAGVRDKLVHIWSLGKFDGLWTCQDSLQLIHEGYTDLLIFVLLTWALLEAKRFLGVTLSRTKRGNSTPSTGLQESAPPPVYRIE